MTRLSGFSSTAASGDSKISVRVERPGSYCQTWFSLALHGRTPAEKLAHLLPAAALP
jgi:hypothetical protein